jgi:NAD(P)-dependent dehydrogenase (short-subunit alcohol dehydrogenase family)
LPTIEKITESFMPSIEQTCVITGAGSGVGRAVALELAKRGWRVACVGRRLERLKETARLAGEHEHLLLLQACDIGDKSGVENTAAEVLERFGGVEVLVNSAGTNVPRRSLAELSDADYILMMSTNLDGAYYWSQALLPQMRARQSGTIVNIVSDAGKIASPKAGPAYVMSKFGLAGLTQSINAEERARGIRACAIFPGDIDTPLLEKRPQPPDAEARKRMMQPEDIARCVMLCLDLPKNVIVEELLVRPR